MAEQTVRVLSAGTALPGAPIDTRALAERFGVDRLWMQWVEAFIGTRTRYLALDLASGRPSRSLADLPRLPPRRRCPRAELSAQPPRPHRARAMPRPRSWPAPSTR
jgi:3-oxoacyl-[acyl-carrier-protein] synthase-3